jgi:hypothetical protein
MGRSPFPARLPLVRRLVLILARVPSAPSLVLVRRIDAVDRRTLQEGSLMAVVAFVIIEHRMTPSVCKSWSYKTSARLNSG